MQTFLPYEDFKESARVLDGKRLLKQRVEVFQILNVLVNKKKAWSNHPAVLQWEGHENALCLYGKCICLESRDRGYKDTLYDKFFEFEDATKSYNMPPWLGDPEIHDSHKSRLKFKGRVDVLIDGFKKYFSFKKTDDWLDSLGFSTKNALQYNEMLALENYAKKLNIKLIESQYSLYWPNIPDNKGYIWPVQIKKN